MNKRSRYNKKHKWSQGFSPEKQGGYDQRLVDTRKLDKSMVKGEKG